MKFYTSHQIALHTAIADNGFAKADFSFVKRKGRIIAEHNHSEHSFSFIERRTSKLDVQKMRMLDDFAYDVSLNGEKEERIPSWEILLEKFNQWLTTISPQ